MITIKIILPFHIRLTIVSAFICIVATLITAPVEATETIVMLRHAEKPDGGLGQINCQGLNRALALPRVLLKKYGVPSAIFVPNPSVRKNDQGHEYSYIRPLATIEPTAIRFSLPINTQWGFEDIEPLKKALLSPELQDATIIVAWEHRLLEKLARDILIKLGGDPREVPVWEGYDFDSIYVITLEKNTEGRRAVAFHIDKEGLNNQSATCPSE